MWKTKKRISSSRRYVKDKLRPFIAALTIFLPLLVFSQPQDAALIEVFFTRHDPVDKKLTSLISGSTQSLEGAFYELSYLPLCQEFKRASVRGVKVSLVLEHERADNTCFRLLQAQGIKIITDIQRPALMHNKFLIIDGQQVWTGSTNLTTRGLFTNRNNAVLIKDPKIASAFRTEFNEMFQDKLFGRESAHNTPFLFNLGPFPLSLLFSPEKDVSKLLFKLLQEASRSITISAFVLTDSSLIKILEQKKAQGLTILLILDKSQAKSTFSIAKKSQNLAENIYIYRGKGKLHHKFMLLDENILVTGSYNFSRNAARYNDENILVLKNREICRLYEAEVERILNSAGRM